MVRREYKRKKLIRKWEKKREVLKDACKQADTLAEKIKYNRLLQQLPRDSSKVRQHNRCMETGRPKGYYRFFGLSRHCIREMAHAGFLPGIRKASW